MVQPDRDPGDAAVEARLRAARAPADPAWCAALEARLFEGAAPVPAPSGSRRLRLPGIAAPWRGARRPARPRRPALVGALAAAGLATVVLVASLAGAGPLAPGGSDGVKAGDDCHYVLEHVRAPVARVVADGHGGTRVVVRQRMVSRHVRRCG